MRSYTCYLILCLFFLARCSTTPNGEVPTALPFPTTTIGAEIRGWLPTPALGSASSLSNPATAVARANQPTATPNYHACPSGNTSLAFTLPSDEATPISSSILNFLNSGGNLQAIHHVLLNANRLGENGQVLQSLDMTGELTPELIFTYLEREEIGMVLILVCENNRYIIRYERDMPTVPTIIADEDLNRDGYNDLLFAVQTCDPIDSFCEYSTTLISWQAQRGIFVNLLLTAQDGDQLPRIADVDNDGIAEIITLQQGTGTSQTGPIRSTTNIYDWNGTQYVLSLSQPAPYRYRIEVIHAADEAFAQNQMEQAGQLLRESITNTDLRVWFQDSGDILTAYALYRLLLVYTFAENGDALSVYQETRNRFSNLETSPIYAFLTETYWQTYQTSNNLHVACLAVQEVIAQRPDTLDLLNRYGSRSPTYQAQALCPF